jgi:A/G-specific adenine glycosylase
VSEWATTVRGALLRWYEGAARDLPWRRTRDPYAVWVSEVMLQQTRVETVLGYYDRFLARFPTSEALASADEDEVMAAFSGLGYYRRARMLHAGVREVVARYGGKVPSDPAARRALPGVGRYTAGAIGSIAFDQPEPIVDGNVARVLCRVLGIDQPVASRAAQAQLWETAERLVQGPRPGALNQALMELGALVCRKQNPACSACPLREQCIAHAQGRAASLPVPSPKRPAPTLAWVGLLATRGHGAGTEVWLDRGSGTLFGGLWNLPLCEGQGRVAASDLLRKSALRGKLASRPVGEIEHVLTHRRLQVELWHVRADAASPGQSLRAVRLRELDALGVSRLTRKALGLLGPSAGLVTRPVIARGPRP